MDRGSHKIALPFSLSQTYTAEELGMRPAVRFCLGLMEKGIVEEEEYIQIGEEFARNREEFLSQSDNTAEEYDKVFRPRTKEGDLNSIRSSIEFMDRHIDSGAITDPEIIEYYNTLKANFSELQ